MADLTPRIASCRKAWRTRLRFYPGGAIPIIELRIGDSRLPAGLDTGSDGDLEFYQKALDNPAVKSALKAAGATRETGARGGYVARTFRLNAPISLGPFTLPAGRGATLDDRQGSAETRLVNIGDRLMAAMKVHLLLDYRDRRIGFFGDCVREGPS